MWMNTKINPGGCELEWAGLYVEQLEAQQILCTLSTQLLRKPFRKSRVDSFS